MNSLGFDKKKQDTKIVVAMSGGVDSSVVAAMLKNEGYDVLGITLKLYNHGRVKNSKSCCAGQDIEDAKKVANQFDFPHSIYDYQDKFYTGVIDDFVETYARGETPVPCIKCNQTVKFHDLLNEAKKNNADALVTGHYARRIKVKNNSKLYKAIDRKKDQSYFLFATLKDQLDYVRFPLGNYLKSEIRDFAKKFNLSVQNKPDSQDICFVTTNSYRDLLEKLKPELNIPGKFLDIEGNTIGVHKGISNYTIGQRKGLGLGGYKKPLYVVNINKEENSVYLGEEKYLKKSVVYLKNVNWLGDTIDKYNLRCSAKIRSTQVEAPGVLNINNDSATFTFDNKISTTSPGQACVFYLKDQVLGGGWITKSS